MRSKRTSTALLAALAGIAALGSGAASAQEYLSAIPSEGFATDIVIVDSVARVHEVLPLTRPSTFWPTEWPAWLLGALETINNGGLIPIGVLDTNRNLPTGEAKAAYLAIVDARGGMYLILDLSRGPVLPAWIQHFVDLVNANQRTTSLGALLMT
ncbi:MAG: hypothetical protein AB1716_10140, partial [Planctomycetota bacterium]